MTDPTRDGAAPAHDRRSRLLEVALLFLKLGSIGFGGPAAHLALLEEEVVVRRRWIDRQRFLDLVGATNLIPGPNSTELAMHLGFVRAGRGGLLLGGLCFLLPAVLITSLLGWAYVRYGQVPEAEPFLRGIQPVVLAVILGAVYRLGRVALRGVKLVAIAVVVVALVLAGVSEIMALLAGGAMGLARGRRSRSRHAAASILCALGGAAAARGGRVAIAASAVGSATSSAVPFSLIALAMFFLKVGAVLYGSGYVLVAFLEGGLVDDLGWITRHQLLDAVAIGQFTPGPLLSTATFVGYLKGGLSGAVVATVSIFLPSFLFVAATARLVPRLRQIPGTAAFLDAVVASAVALMAVVTVKLGTQTLTSFPAAGLAMGAAVVVVRFRRVNPAFLVIAGALVGWLLPGWG